jgi:hypothetical protein
MDVALAMHHFPWLHFRVAGEGWNIRGQQFKVHFIKTPSFARALNEVDLSALDPRMWKSRYVVDLVSRQESMTTFSLRPLAEDRDQKNALKDALVTLDDNYATRTLVLHYANGGSITLNLTPESKNGYLLPVTAEAQIDMPGQSLTAEASFSDYALDSGPAVAAGQRRS